MKSKYQWTHKPELILREHYGMYINVPFCQSFCSFCPFYKVKYTEDKLKRYVSRLKEEISLQELPGSPDWIYFGGGTPNLLSIDQLGEIVHVIKDKVGFPEAGIELMPGITTESYIDNLAELGFKKISLGVESLDLQVNKAVRRQAVKSTKVEEVVKWAKSRGLFVNIDLIAGLQKQNTDSFLKDLSELIYWGPSQLTIYPYMVVRGFNVEPGFDSEEQFRLIEQAWGQLSRVGYKRLSPWTFANREGEYDCSKAELVNDYIGFGAGSFSTNFGWKVVNPPVDYYLNTPIEQGKALISRKEVTADQWRMFGKMLSDLRINTRSDLSSGINAYIIWLRASGYLKNGSLTDKGMLLAHHLMKTIVESLPFPLLDIKQVSNPSEFLKDTEYKSTSKAQGLAESA